MNHHRFIIALSEGVGDPYPYVNIEAKQFVARMTEKPDDTRKGLIDDLFGALKNGATSGSNILAKLDALYIFAAPAEQIALLNWAAATLPMTAAGGIALTADAGYVGDGVDDYLTPSIAPSQLTKYVQNSAFVALGLNVDGNNTGTVVGLSGAGIQRLALNPRGATGVVSGRLNSSSTFNTTATVASRVGRTYLSRTDNSQVGVYRDGSLVETVSTASADPSSQTDSIVLPRNNTAYLDDGVNMLALGSGFDADEVADFDAAIAAFINAIAPP